MGKLLLYASVAAALATTALGFINRSKLTAAQAELKTSKQSTDTAIAQIKVELEKSRDTVKTITEEKDQAIAQVESTKTALEKSESQVKELQNQIKAKADKVTELETAVERLNITIANMSGPKGPCVQCAEKQAIIDEKEALTAKLQNEINDLQARIDKFAIEKPDRPALKKRNGPEGRILAVNQAWNFVVLNLGDKNGVVGNAEMLIKRGDRLVGKARVTSVEPATSIADIVPSSVPHGESIQPGDTVIYQATAE